MEGKSRCSSRFNGCVRLVYFCSSARSCPPLGPWLLPSVSDTPTLCRSVPDAGCGRGANNSGEDQVLTASRFGRGKAEGNEMASA